MHATKYIFQFVIVTFNLFRPLIAYSPQPTDRPRSINCMHKTRRNKLANCPTNCITESLASRDVRYVRSRDAGKILASRDAVMLGVGMRVKYSLLGMRVKYEGYNSSSYNSSYNHFNLDPMKLRVKTF